MTESPGRHLFHLAVPHDWHAAVVAGGPYAMSTRGRTLDQVGFIHCAFRAQVLSVAEMFYGDVSDLVVLMIDPDLLEDEIRVENLDGGSELFPHVYGPLPVSAVVEERPFASWVA